MKSIFVVMLFLLLATTKVEAEEKSPLFQVMEKFDGHSKLGRVAFAKKLLTLNNAIKAGLPLLKPSEAEWLAREEAEIEKLKQNATGYSDRWGRLFYLSPEYQHQQLEGALQNMREALDCVTDDKVQLRREMFCWAVVGYHAAKEQDWERWMEVTKKSGRLTLGGLGAKPPEPSIIAGIINGLSGNIQTEIIIPYLRGDTFTK